MNCAFRFANALAIAIEDEFQNEIEVTFNQGVPKA